MKRHGRASESWCYPRGRWVEHEHAVVGGEQDVAVAELAHAEDLGTPNEVEGDLLPRAVVLEDAAEGARKTRGQGRAPGRSPPFEEVEVFDVRRSRGGNNTRISPMMIALGGQGIIDPGALCVAPGVTTVHIYDRPLRTDEAVANHRTDAHTGHR